jgi:hypothetical protein
MLMKESIKKIANIDERIKKAVLVIYAAVCFLMNFIRIFDNAFWGDEGWSIKLINMNLHDMIQATAGAQQPPLYFMIAMLFCRIGGNSGPVYHFVSIIPYLILVILSITMIRRKFSYMASMIYLTFVSLSTAGLTYNIEVRMYSWAGLFVFLTWGASLEILEKDRWKDWIRFTVFSILTAYTNYYALLAVGFLYLSFIIYFCVTRKLTRSGIKLVTSMAAALISYLPWLRIMIRSFQNTVNNDFWLQNPTRLRYVLTFILNSKWIVFLAVVILCSFFVRQIKNGKIHDSVMVFIEFGLFSAAGLIATGEIVSLIYRPVFQAKYAYSICSIIWLVLGIAVSKLKYRKQVFCLLFSVMLIIMIPGYFKTFAYDRQLNQDTTAFLNDVRIEKEDYIMTSSSQIDWTLLDYYYPGTKHQYFDGTDPDKISKAVNSAASGRNNAVVWLFWYGPLSSEETLKLKDTGYNSEVYFTGRLGNGEKLFVYKLNKIG